MVFLAGFRPSATADGRTVERIPIRKTSMSQAPRPFGLPRASAPKALVPVNFICLAPGAQSVAVVGDFNDWNPQAHPLAQAFDGSWQGSLKLRHGHHRYAFWVDGTLQVDPRGQGVSRNDQGERVSLIAVS
ncbi:MAG: hypothetical protein RIT19_1884 [Verrucomicrobiota bacterium]|jgi:1,4-alpha-glucan branching enzyme